MAHMVMAAHSQVHLIWTRQPQSTAASGYGYYRLYNPPQGCPSSHLRDDALKYTGWTDLPQTGITPEKWVEFYTLLQLMAVQFGIGLMPFDALDLQYAQGGHAFCLCGLGHRVFILMGSSLFLVIQKLLPVSDPQISSKVQSAVGGTEWG